MSVKYSSQKNFNHLELQKIGILLVNLGTPDAPTTKSLKKYLKQFLSDPRVIELPKYIWFFILNFIVLPFRAPKSSKKYRTIWGKKGSPLLVQSQNLTFKLQKKLPSSMICALAMSYGKPSICDALENLREQNCKKLLVLPMYPQYSATTVASVFDEVCTQLKKWRWIPELRFVNQYHDEEAYIRALAASLLPFKKIAKNQKIVFSYHGTPLQSLLDGDPYHCQCHKTSRLIAEKLKLKKENYLTCFQSRFGSSAWLQPYTDETLKSLPQKKINEVFIICPGFSIDCLETLEEINSENREIFLKNGGKKFTYISCLNDSKHQLKLFQTLVDIHTQNWAKQEKKTREKQNHLYQQLFEKHSFFSTNR